MDKKILVMDDDPLVLRTLTKLFNKEGYSVVTAQGGKEALEKITETDFDLVISDIKMAGIDGVETATAIKSYFNKRDKPEIPIVFITGYADIADQKHAQELGEVLIKPFDNEELLENVRIETEIYPHKKTCGELQIEKRFSPRLATNFSLRVFPDSKGGNVLNISETGICFDCEGPALSGDILLSINLLPSKPEQPIEIPARVIWHNILAENRFQFGAQFSLLEKDLLYQIRDFIFDNFAKKASSIIEDNNDLKTKVQDFFNNDIRKFHEEMTSLAHEVAQGSIKPDVAEQKTTALINDLLLKKGHALEKMVSDERSMKKIKQLFRDLTGCWYYKSPIVKMAYDKPRGYPGDYKLFEIIYDKKPLAENKTLGFCWDNYFLNNGYAQAARSRKNKMKNILQDLIENSDLKTVRLLNVACGPSREIRELLCDPYLSQRKDIVFTGLDYDEESLKFSQAKFNNLPPNFKVRLIHANVLSIFRDPKYYDLIGKQDVIYILGLTEYLPDRIFRNLTKFLFRLLNDKGTLVITYKDQDIEFPSLPPEWLCDWAFIKRTKDDLIETTKQLGSDKFSLKIEREGTGTIFFLILTKT